MEEREDAHVEAVGDKLAAIDMDLDDAMDRLSEANERIDELLHSDEDSAEPEEAVAVPEAPAEPLSEETPTPVEAEAEVATQAQDDEDSES